MAINLSTKRAGIVNVVELDNCDGTPMLTDDGERATVTMHGPATKQYAQAEAEARRVRAAAVKKSNGDLYAGLENSDEINKDFLARIVIKWDHIDHDDAKEKGLTLAILNDPELGFITSKMVAEMGNWSAMSKRSGKA